jgi:hypothetical protein
MPDSMPSLQLLPHVPGRCPYQAGTFLWVGGGLMVPHSGPEQARPHGYVSHAQPSERPSLRTPPAAAPAGVACQPCRSVRSACCPLSVCGCLPLSSLTGWFPGLIPGILAPIPSARPFSRSLPLALSASRLSPPCTPASSFWAPRCLGTSPVPRARTAPTVTCRRTAKLRCPPPS